LADKTHIRLITIEPGLPYEPIHVQLNERSLTEAGPYAALSYTWGDGIANKPILCNGYRFQVTTNLYSALLKLRKSSGQVRIWVDRLCINQEDVEERSDQVRHMGRIYASAAVVMIWLGEETKDTYLAFEAIRNLAHNSTNITRALTPSQITAIEKILLNPWFTRTWVVQEVVLSNEAYLMCGSQQISWKDWYYYCFRQWQSGWLKLVDKGYVAVIMMGTARLAKISKDDRHHRLLTLNALLANTRTRACTDPRDKVYSLLGIASCQGKIFPDYSKTAADVFTETARTLIIEYQHLEVLSNAIYLERQASIPSWVPDWSRPSDCLPLGMRNTNGGARYHAALTTKPSVIDDKSSPYKLKLRGLQVDRVAIIYSASKGLEKLDVDWSLISPKQICSICKSIGLHGIYPFTGEPFSDAYLKVLCTDIMPASGRADSAFNNLNFPITANGAQVAGLSTAEFELEVQRELASMIHSLTVGRCLFISKRGYIGLGPKAACKGDILSVLLGGDLIYLLRTNGQETELVGECYVHGLMDGEALKDFDSSKADFEVFSII
jgi:Heterokaryon incompatibility protein (HET)